MGTGLRYIFLSSGLSKAFPSVADVLGIVQPLQWCAFPYLEGKPHVAFGGEPQEGNELSTTVWSPVTHTILLSVSLRRILLEYSTSRVPSVTLHTAMSSPSGR